MSRMLAAAQAAGERMTTTTLDQAPRYSKDQVGREAEMLQRFPAGQWTRAIHVGLSNVKVQPLVEAGLLEQRLEQDSHHRGTLATQYRPAQPAAVVLSFRTIANYEDYELCRVFTKHYWRYVSQLWELMEQGDRVDAEIAVLTQRADSVEALIKSLVVA